MPGRRRARCGARLAIDQHRVHAEGRERLLHAAEVARREAQRAPAAVALHHDPRDQVGPAQHARHVVEIAAGDGVARAGARQGAAGVADEIVRARLEGEQLPEPREVVEAARAVLAEAEVAPHHDDLGGQAPRQHFGGERLRGQRGEGEIEALHAGDERRIHAPDELQLAIEGGEQRRHRAAQHGARVRREREDGGREAAAARVVGDGGEHRLVATVDAVEVADGDHAPGGAARVLLVLLSIHASSVAKRAPGAKARRPSAWIGAQPPSRRALSGVWGRSSHRILPRRGECLDDPPLDC